MANRLWPKPISSGSGTFQQHGTGIIGSPVRERAGGLFQDRRRDLGFTRQDANDAAHLKCLLAS
jgi:hypothetical protein